jgi:hypothetical protein
VKRIICPIHAEIILKDCMMKNNDEGRANINEDEILDIIGTSDNHTNREVKYTPEKRDFPNVLDRAKEVSGNENGFLLKQSDRPEQSASHAASIIFSYRNFLVIFGGAVAVYVLKILIVKWMARSSYGYGDIRALQTLQDAEYVQGLMDFMALLLFAASLVVYLVTAIKRKSYYDILILFVFVFAIFCFAFFAFVVYSLISARN